MKKIQALIRPDRVFLGVDAEDKDAALESISKAFSRFTGIDSEKIRIALKERELLGSTAVGGGFAIPHAKLKGLDDIVTILVRFSRDLDFSNGDSIRMAAAVLSPPDQPAAHLQVLSQIARLLKHEDFRTKLITAESVEEVVDIVRETAGREGL